VETVVLNSAPARYVPVRRATRSRYLAAAIEDRRDGVAIPVTNASLAVVLSDLLNREDRGEALPPAAPSHVPSRFQVAHNPYGHAPHAVWVEWVNSVARRIVAVAPSEADARRIAKLLNHVDFPGKTKGFAWWLLLVPWLLGPRVMWPSMLNDPADREKLLEPTLQPANVPTPRHLKRRAIGLTALLLMPTIFGLALLAAISWPLALLSAIGVVVVTAGVLTGRIG